MALSSSVLTSFHFYDELFFNASQSAAQDVMDDPSNLVRIERAQGSNLDVVFQENNGGGDNDANQAFGLCHLSTIFGFTREDRNPILSRFEESFAVALAAHHLNTGNASLVPALEGLHDANNKILTTQADACPIRFTVGFADIQASTGSALRTVVEQTDSPVNRNDGASAMPRPCAFVGAYRSAMSIPTSMITGLRNYPQVSGGSTSQDLDDTQSYPLFARSISSDASNSGPILQFFQSELGVAHLAVLHVNDAYGNAFAAGLRNAAKVIDMTLSTVGFSSSSNAEEIREAVESLKISQFRYFFVIAFEVFDELMVEAHRQGIAGADGTHSWFFSDSFEPDQVMKRSFERDSILQQAYNGIGFIGSTAGTAGMASFDKFQEQMRALQNEEDIDYLVQRNVPDFDLLYDESFLRPTLSSFAAFYYDAAIALGLAACKAVQRNVEASSPEQMWTLDGKEHYNTLVEQEFEGVTGSVVLDKETGSRDAKTTFFRVINFVVDEKRSTEGTVNFKQVVSNIFQGGAWQLIDDFRFSSGQTEIPQDLPPYTLDENRLEPQVKVLVFAMCSISVALAISCAIWTKFNSHTRVVRASQPIFLYILCCGALILALSIIPASHNHLMAAESISNIHLACNFIPWLVIMGVSLLFSALFTKTRRVNWIMNSSQPCRRIKVTAADVAKPMIGILLVNAIILTLMTALAPLKWQVNVVSIDGLRELPTETYGGCSLGEEQLPYMMTLAFVNIGLLFFTSFEAYRARNLSTEFAESQYIFRVLMSIILVCFVGGPVLFLANEDPNAYIFVGSAIIFVTSSSTLLWIFVPKIIFSRDPKTRERHTVVHVDFTLDSNAELGSESQQWNSAIETVSSDGGWAGERIIASATQQELAIEKERLRKESERFRKETTHYKHECERFRYEFQRFQEEALKKEELRALSSSTEDNHSSTQAPVDASGNKQEVSSGESHESFQPQTTDEDSGSVFLMEHDGSNV